MKVGPESFPSFHACPDPRVSQVYLHKPGHITTNGQDDMSFLANAIGMGITATFLMDFFGRLLVKAGVVRQRMKPTYVGRWVLHMFRGVFRHEDIDTAPPFKFEIRVSLIAHYLIGIGLAGLYLLLEGLIWTTPDSILPPLLFGIATTILPWFWLFPSFGYGFLASKREHRIDYLVTSTVNHLVFGVGLTLWMVFLYPVVG